MDVSIDRRDECSHVEGSLEEMAKLTESRLTAPKQEYHWLLLTTHDGEGREIRVPVTPKKQAS